ncbi:MAG: response regulator receiver protein [Xanthomonadaceae bacterium]|nr:response regulator receiver protein [Xanthomonadaceae bacterium]
MTAFPDSSSQDAATIDQPASEPSRVDEPPYRVLVAEDDASQAMFAEGVLRGAGIEARAVRIAADVLPEMKNFHPDLVLLDLHMPGMSGTDLIGLIRLDPDFAHIPVVFLTGDPDLERQFEALEQGADDFLNKPIRPRHLIAAVQSRIKRARALHRQRSSDTSCNKDTGLYHRPFLLQLIAAALAAGDGGGALLVEVQGVAALRDRYGYSGFEGLMHDAGRCVAQRAGANPCARLNDSAFLVLGAGSDEPSLDALARVLRDGIGHAAFDCDGMPQRLRVVVGWAALRHFAEPGAVVVAIEQAARAARSQAIGLFAHVPADTAANQRANALTEAMRAGLRDGTFELAFQPIVAVAGGDDAQFQALLRLRDADGSLKQASVLVPTAEAAGLMPDIDRWVLAQAIERMHRRHEMQLALRLFVSQSSRSLADEQHAPWLLQQLASGHVADGSLVIDLRLDDALVHPDMIAQFCDAVKGAGVRFCLSQYLHGPEADALLQQLPLHYVRLSPRYSGVHADPVLREKLRSVIDNAHRLGLLVIGPQVEDPQGAATFWMSGIDLIQGNLVQQADGNLDFDFSHAVL